MPILSCGQKAWPNVLLVGKFCMIVQPFLVPLNRFDCFPINNQMAGVLQSTIPLLVQHKNVDSMEHSRTRRSRRKALRDCVGSVGSFFFSSWPHKDRVVLRSLYDRYVANRAVLIRENEAAGGGTTAASGRCGTR
ncbi:hypothetical protein MRX96_010423 [Rhipicephalus microplus]